MTVKQVHKGEDVRNRVRKIESRFEILRTIIAIAIAMAIVMVTIAIVSDSPLEAIRTLLLGPLSTLRRFANVIELMVPLAFTGLALTVVFTSNRFNLSSDSAFYMGGMIAVIIALFTPAPPIVVVILAMLGAFIGGAIIGGIPAVIGNKFGANVLVISLMLNYAVGFLVKYLFSYVVRDPNKNAQQSYALPNGVNLGNMLQGTRIHYGVIIMLLIIALVYIFIYKTRWGYSLRTVGANEKFATYTGINVPLVVILAQVVGTGIAGLGGAVELLGMYRSFMWIESPGYGFDGVIIATLARTNPKNIPLAAFFLAYVRVGADILNRTSDIPAEIISIVQATIILLIAAQAFLSKWKEKEIVKASNVDETPAEVA